MATSTPSKSSLSQAQSLWWNNVRAALLGEIFLWCREQFKCNVAVRFSNRKGKFYVTAEADDDVIIYNTNSYEYQKGLRKIAEKICPDAYMTSGGVNCFTFRLNKDLPVVKKSRKDIKITKRRLKQPTRVFDLVDGTDSYDQDFHLFVMQDNTIKVVNHEMRFNAPRVPKVGNALVHSVITITTKDV